MNTSQKPIGTSPLALTYGMEVIFPMEIGMPTLRTGIPEEANVEAIANDLDMSDELHQATVVRVASYQQRLENM